MFQPNVIDTISKLWIHGEFHIAYIVNTHQRNAFSLLINIVGN